MKKKEAELLAPEKVDVILDYIKKILEDSTKVSVEINFNSAKINGQNVCTIDIYVPLKNFERHLNLGIPNNFIDILYNEFLNRVIVDIFPHETIEATRIYHLRSNLILFDGINIINSIGSEIKVNMYGIDKNIVEEYNLRHDEFKKSLMSDDNSLKRKV